MMHALSVAQQTCVTSQAHRLSGAEGMAWLAGPCIMGACKLHETRRAHV